MRSAHTPAYFEVPYAPQASVNAPFKQELLDAVAGVLDQGDCVFGAEVTALEKRFTEILGARYAVAVGSSSDAFELTLRAIGVRDGNEVIVPANAPVSTVSAIILAGGVPSFVDVGPDYNIDPQRIEDAITPRTRVILPVHMTGRPAEMDLINSLASDRGLLVVEDGSQAVFARYRGRPVGSLGHAACFRLHPLISLGTFGDGGVAVTDDQELAGRLRTLCANRQRDEEVAAHWRAGTPLGTLQASMLLVKLSYGLSWTEQRRRNAAFYQEALGGGLPGVQVPYDKESEYAVYETFVVQAEERHELIEYLRRHGIATVMCNPVPVHLQPVAVTLGYRVGDFVNAERQAKSALRLPIYAGLEEQQLQHVAQAIETFCRRAVLGTPPSV